MEADDDAILAKILVNENEGGVKVKYVVSDYLHFDFKDDNILDCYL